MHDGMHMDVDHIKLYIFRSHSQELFVRVYADQQYRPGECSGVIGMQPARAKIKDYLQLHSCQQASQVDLHSDHGPNSLAALYIQVYLYLNIGIARLFNKHVCDRQD
jgi:hypothetical protein